MVSLSRRYLPVGLEDQSEQRVIVEVLPDAREIVDYVNPNFPKVVGGSYAGEEEKLRAVDRPTADDHLSFGCHGLDAPAPLILDPGTALAAVEGQAARKRVGVDSQVRPIHSRVQVGERGALTLTVRDGQLVPARPLLYRAIEVVGRGIAELLGRVEEDLRKRVRIRSDLGMHGSALSPILGVAALDRLHLLKVRQDALVVPAGCAAGGPVVEVVTVAAQVDHRVDGTRSTKYLTARPVVREIARPELRRCFVGPVDLRAPQSRPCRRGMQFLLGILGAGLQQQDLRAVLA